MPAVWCCAPFGPYAMLSYGMAERSRPAEPLTPCSDTRGVGMTGQQAAGDPAAERVSRDPDPGQAPEPASAIVMVCRDPLARDLLERELPRRRLVCRPRSSSAGLAMEADAPALQSHRGMPDQPRGRGWTRDVREGRGPSQTCARRICSARNSAIHRSAAL